MEAIDLAEYGRALKKRWWIIVSLVVISCTLTAIYSYLFVTPVYQASSKLIVNKSDSGAELINQINVGEISANLLLINTYKEIIRTSAIMDQVVDRYPEFGMTVEQLVRRIQVSSSNDSQVMTIAVVDPSYTRAMNIVNAVAEVFKESIPTIMKVDNVTILDQAKPKLNPIPLGFNPSFNIVVGFIVAFMIAVGICFMLEFLDDTIRSERDIKDVVGLPTLATVHRVTRRDLNSRKNRNIQPVKEAPYATVNQ